MSPVIEGAEVGRTAEEGRGEGRGAALQGWGGGGFLAAGPWLPAMVQLCRLALEAGGWRLETFL